MATTSRAAVQEAERQMQLRLEEYRKKRELRLKEKELANNSNHTPRQESDDARKARQAAEQWSQRADRARSASPVPLNTRRRAGKKKDSLSTSTHGISSSSDQAAVHPTKAKPRRAKSDMTRAQDDKLKAAAKMDATRQARLQAEEEKMQQRRAAAAAAKKKKQQQQQQQQQAAAAEEEEAKRKAEEEKRKAKEKAEKEEAAKQKAKEEAAKRKSEEEQEKKRKQTAAEEAKRKAEAAAEAEKQRQAAEKAQRKAAKQKAKEEAEAAAQQKVKEEAAAKQLELEQVAPPPPPTKLTPKEKKQAQQHAAQTQAQVQETQQQLDKNRLQQWKKQQQQKQKTSKTKSSSSNSKNNDDVVVERIPKLSALLAMGGPMAAAYRQQVQQQRLAQWSSQLGDKWHMVQQTFEGRSISETTKEDVRTDLTLRQAVQEFQANPERYIALVYQNYKPTQQPPNQLAVSKPKSPVEFSFILRQGTSVYEPLDTKTDGSGSFVLWQHIFHRLPPLPKNLLPSSARDQFTDKLTFGGKPCHDHTAKQPKRLPILPGRGMGVGDEANMTWMGSDNLPMPDHVRQGACVGDCWLLSAIACVADFDFAIHRLFRKTPQFPQKPHDEAVHNRITVTLWDLKTWKEVDVVIDERLPVRPDGSGFLLGAKPSRDGKFWVPYLEKAIAIHCGGYDKICGGNCTDAWPMVTGSRNQFMITKNPKTKKYQCNAKYNPQEQKWSVHSNSPHDSNRSHWRVDWPVVGGGGDLNMELTQDELFERIVMWDEHNYLTAAATSGTSDQQTTNGIVDNHAYSIIDSRQNICGTGIDLLLIRNPWGEGGELQNGQFMRSGSGWTKYPEIQKALNPTTEDNGLCWVIKKEFFKYFPTIYVCAFDMTRLKDPKYANDLTDHFKRRPKAAAKPKPKPKPVEEEHGPIYVNKDSIPGSPYKVVEQSYNGGVAFCEMNKKDVQGRSIADAVEEFKANGDKYLAMHYQESMVAEGWPTEVHKFTFILREGSEGLEVDEVPKGEGKRTMLTNVLR